MAPAAAHACEQSDEGERYEARSELAFSGDDREIRRTTVVLCDRRSGRERVLRRGRLDSGTDRGVGYHGAAAAGRRLVWVEERRWRGRARVVLVEARATDGSVFRRRELARNREGFGAREHQAVVTAGGNVATVVSEADTQRLVLRRGGREVREIERAFIKALGIEDGRTLRWLASGPTFGRRYLDLAPLPRNDAGCPARERFRRSELTEGVEITEARYGELGETSVLRACLRDTGRDIVVGEGESSFGDSRSVAVPVIDGDWIAVQRSVYSRYYGCESVSLSPLNLRTGARGPGASIPLCDGLRTDEPAVITPAGVLAWVARREDAWTVRTALRDRDPLDTGPPGAITGLRAEGSLLRWENAGQPCSAEIEPAA
jgi:hypothetical protein